MRRPPKRPNKRELELLDCIDGLQQQICQLHEAIAPGQKVSHQECIAIAKLSRMSISNSLHCAERDWTPTRPPIHEKLKQ